MAKEPPIEALVHEWASGSIRSLRAGAEEVHFHPLEVLSDRIIDHEVLSQALRAVVSHRDYDAECMKASLVVPTELSRRPRDASVERILKRPRPPSAIAIYVKPRMWDLARPFRCVKIEPFSDADMKLDREWCMFWETSWWDSGPPCVSFLVEHRPDLGMVRWP
jgi:hypothetical protein